MSAARFPVEAGHILMFARALGDENPAYQGALTGEAVSAPPTFAWAAAHFDPECTVRPRPGAPWPPRAAGGLHAEQSYTYHRPVRSGDVLSVTERPGRSWVKASRSGGSLHFAEMLSEYRDEAGELVVTACMTTVIPEQAP
jgi:acyl dehydratase